MRPVFVHTSGFYAVLDRTDSFHSKATLLFVQAEQESWPLVTTNYVVHESIALIQSRLGWEALDDFFDVLLPLCELVWVDRQLHELGLARHRQARERRLSLTDCVSIAWMKREQVDDGIFQDEHFDREHFRLAG